MIKPEFVSRYHLTKRRHLGSDPITRHFQEGLIAHASHSLSQIQPSKAKPKPKSFHQTATTFKTKFSTKFKPSHSASTNQNLSIKTEGTLRTIPKANMTLLNLRELLKLKGQIKKEEQEKISQNPFYKIMKRRKPNVTRARTELSEKLEEEGPYIKPDIIKELSFDEGVERGERGERGEKDEEFSNLMIKASKVSLRKKDSEVSVVRQKSDTRIYEEIKRYFQEKYYPKR